jgi:hypothetical protein
MARIGVRGPPTIMSNSSTDNPRSAIRNPQSPVTDSPWFWVLAFSLMGLLALVVIGGKYSRRQANIERNYQARERVAQRVTAEAQAENNSGAAPRIGDLEAQRAYATPRNRLVPVWPLAILLTLVSIASAGMLYRRRVTTRNGNSYE